MYNHVINHPNVNADDVQKFKSFWDSEKVIIHHAGYKILNIYLEDLKIFKRINLNYRALNNQKVVFMRDCIEPSFFNNDCLVRATIENYDLALINFLNSAHSYVDLTRRLYSKLLGTKAKCILDELLDEYESDLEFTLVKDLRNIVHHGTYLPVSIRFKLIPKGDINRHSFLVSSEALLSVKKGLNQDQKEYVRLKSSQGKFSFEELIKKFHGMMYVYSTLRRRIFFDQNRAHIKDYLSDYSEFSRIAKQAKLSNALPHKPYHIRLFQRCLRNQLNR